MVPLLLVLGSEAVLMVLGTNLIDLIGEKLQRVCADDQVVGLGHGAYHVEGVGHGHYERLPRAPCVDPLELHQFQALSQSQIREDQFLEGFGWNAARRVVPHDGLAQITLVLSRRAIDGIDQVSEDDA